MSSLFGLLGLLVLTACASSGQKARQDQREKLATSSGLYCEWVSGDKHSDLDVELNLRMAKRCDPSKPFSLTPYKNSSDQNGILYCCATASPARKSTAAPGGASAVSSPAAGVKAAPGAGSSSDEIVEDK